MKKQTKTILALLIGAAMSLSVAGCTTGSESSSAVSISKNGDSSTASSDDSKNTGSAVSAKPGETVTGEDLKISFEKAKQYDSIVQSEFYTDKPADGKKFLVLFFEAENISDEEQYVSGYSFKAYEDDYDVDMALIMSEPDGYKALSANLAPGKKIKGYIAYEVNSGWKKFELKHSSLLSDADFSFELTPDDLTQ